MKFHKTSFSKLMIHTYSTDQWLPLTLSQAWDFFSSPKNLAFITPPAMDFRILHPTEEKTYAGMLIDYKVRPLFGIPVYWQTKIIQVDEPHSFTDLQLKGPYRLWEHTHYFFEKEGGVLMQDRVRYQLPFGLLGELVHKMLVKAKIGGIFDFRRKKLETLFPGRLKTPETQAGSRF